MKDETRAAFEGIRTTRLKLPVTAVVFLLAAADCHHRILILVRFLFCFGWTILLAEVAGHAGREGVTEFGPDSGQMVRPENCPLPDRVAPSDRPFPFDGSRLSQDEPMAASGALGCGISRQIACQWFKRATSR